MRDLLTLLREKQREIEELERELSGYETKRKRLAKLKAEMRDAAAVLSGNPILTKPKSRHGFVGGKRAKPIQHGSSVWWTWKVLFLVGQQMHIDRILDRIERESGERFKKATIVSNLSRYVQHNDTFTRPAPNVFGLIDFSSDPDAAAFPFGDPNAYSSDEEE